MANRKTNVIGVRVSKRQHDEWKAAAAAAGISLTQWVTFKCNGILLVKTDTRAA